MKLNKFLVILFAFSLVLFTKAFAQEEQEMDRDTWQARMEQAKADIADLTAKKDALQKDIDALTKQLNDKNAELTKVTNEYNTLVPQAKYDEFNKDLKTLEGIVNKKEGKKEDAEALYAKLAASNLKCHPDFADRMKKVKQGLDSWQIVEQKPAGYTVVKGDCLYKIAGKKEIYNDPKMWPVLWEANEKGVISAPPKVKKTIKNPNLIYPGQVLSVPKLTDALKKSGLEKAKKWKRSMKKRVVKEEGKTEEKKEVKKEEKKDVKKEEKKDTKKEEKKDVKKEEKKDTKKEEKKK
jgi:hypothetical protein